jgi:SAM-dependent methyltransferase
MVMSSESLSERDRAEVQRSAAEASKAELAPVEIDRYVTPSPNTPYGLEYAFYLLGDVRGKTVLDLGCGTGETLIPLIKRGARVIGIDISPELIDLARRRVASYGLENQNVEVRVGSAYETGLPNESVDVVFSIALLHHLDLPKARAEIFRVLRPGGLFILREPIRFSRTIARLRKLFPSPDADISEFEHPMTRQEIATVTQGFKKISERSFRLPLVPLLVHLKSFRKRAWLMDRWLLAKFPALAHFATGKVMSLQK